MKLLRNIILLGLTGILYLSISFSAISQTITQDTTELVKAKKTKVIIPRDPVKATYLAFCPGLGQIYNRKYWKLPIVYGALGGGAYFLGVNQRNITIARHSLRARLVVPGYNLHPKYQNASKDQIEADALYYRRNRDIGAVIIAGVYLLQIVDAVVDAHLSTFDVSKNLSYQFRPSFSDQGLGVRMTF